MINLEKRIRSFYSLNIDSHIMGLGGDDSWTASVHEGNTNSNVNSNTYTYTNATTIRLLTSTRTI